MPGLKSVCKGFSLSPTWGCGPAADLAVHWAGSGCRAFGPGPEGPGLVLRAGLTWRRLGPDYAGPAGHEEPTSDVFSPPPSSASARASLPSSGPWAAAHRHTQVQVQLKRYTRTRQNQSLTFWVSPSRVLCSSWTNVRFCSTSSYFSTAACKIYKQENS